MMSDKLRAAAQSALEWLESTKTQSMEEYLKVVDGLKAALAEPAIKDSLTVAEPVGWLHWLTVDGERFPQLTLMPRTDKDEPLYTAPLAEQKPMLEMNPQKREWVGLTDDERVLITDVSRDHIDAMILVEANLREKNG